MGNGRSSMIKDSTHIQDTIKKSPKCNKFMYETIFVLSVGYSMVTVIENNS